jgi:DNA-binding transcriptional MerR regulator
MSEAAISIHDRLQNSLGGNDAADGTLYTITELAAELEITARTIRFYETKGLITPRRAGTTRVYSRRDRARMILILRGKRLGFSLREIKEYLDLYSVDTTRVEQLRVLLKGVRKRLGELEEQRTALEITLGELKDIERLAVSELRAKGKTIS